jgi:hypothetical protein
MGRNKWFAVGCPNRPSLGNLMGSDAQKQKFLSKIEERIMESFQAWGYCVGCSSDLWAGSFCPFPFYSDI